MATGNPISTLALPRDAAQRLALAPIFNSAMMSSDKAEIAALKALNEKFEKASPTHTYDFGDSLKFRIVIPFKDLIGQATEAEKKDLELYNKHQELLSSIDKVKGAFKDYLSVAEAVKEASPQALKRARYLEKDKGIALVKSYQDLIELAKATGKAEMNLFALMDDTQAALKTATRSMGNVYYTVHMLRTRISVQGLVEQPELVKDKFLELVTDYNDRIKPQALSELGNHTSEYEKDFAEAFVEGLASVPGLQAPDVELFKSQLMVAQEEGQDYTKMLNRFSSEIDLFINGQKDTISAQYKSLSLESFITGAQMDDLQGVRDQLKQVKTLRDQRDALVNELRETQQRIVSIEATQNAKTAHTVGDLLGFVRSSVQEDRKPYVYDENKALQELIKIEKEIAKKVELSDQKIAALMESIQKKKEELATLQAGFETRVVMETRLEALIKKEKVQLELDEKAHNENIANLAKERSEGPNAQQTWEKMSAAQAVYAVKLKHSVDQLGVLKQQQKTIEEELRLRGEKIKTLGDEIETDEKVVRESENIGHPDVRDDLQMLRELQEARANDKFEITGIDLIAMAANLVILVRPGTLGRALKEAREKAEEAATLELKQEELEATYRAVEEQIDGTQFPGYVVYKARSVEDQVVYQGSLMITAKFFSEDQYEDMRQAMADKLDTAIEISRKVHTAAAKKRTELFKQVVQKEGKDLTGLEQEAVLKKLARSVEKRSAQDVEATESESEDEDEAEFSSRPASLSAIVADTVPASGAVQAAAVLEEASVVLPPSIAMTPAPVRATGLSVALVEAEDTAEPAPLPPAVTASSPGLISRTFGPARGQAKDYDPKGAPSGLFGRIFSRLFVRGDHGDVKPKAAPLLEEIDGFINDDEALAVMLPAAPVAPLPEATPAPASPAKPKKTVEGTQTRWTFSEV